MRQGFAEDGAEPMPDAELPAVCVLVALDASPHSRRALRAAAELAARMRAELRGLFVEDVNLIRLSNLTFCYEVSTYMTTPRRLDSRTIERDLRIQAQQLRHALAQAAVLAHVNWSFHVVRGSVTHELLTAANEAAVLTLGRIGRTPGKRLGSTAQIVMRQALRPVFLLGDEALRFPPVVLHTGSPAADRALELAISLLDNDKTALQLITVRAANEDAEAQATRSVRLVHTLESRDIDIALQQAANAAQIDALLDTLLDAGTAGTIILPIELVDRLETDARSAIVVP